MINLAKTNMFVVNSKEDLDEALEHYIRKELPNTEDQWLRYFKPNLYPTEYPVIANFFLDRTGLRKVFASYAPVSSITDGYHTFDELYEHRASLFLALGKAINCEKWYSFKHNDGSMYDDMFIVGIDLPTGTVTYHYNVEPWLTSFQAAGFKEIYRAPEWDGHTPEEVVRRLMLFAIT